MKGQRMILVGCMVFVAWSLLLVQAERSVVAVVVKDPNFKGAPVLKLNAHKLLSAPSNQASIQQVQPIVAHAENEVYTPADLGHDASPVPVFKEKPRKVIRYKLIRMSDADIKKEAEAKRLQKLKDAEDARLKKLLYPCQDYSPICSQYRNIWNPAIAQCRDVFMQRNCRESCGLCKIPWGVYLACQDIQHCKKLGTHSCVYDWVKETCKTMCGSCDGSKGGKNVRVGASSVFVGKKKSEIVSKKDEKKKDDKKTAVKTVHQAIKLQAKPIKIEDPSPKQEEKVDSKTPDDSDDDADDEKDDDKEDDSDDMEKQPADSNMENESGDGKPEMTPNSENDKATPKPKVAKKSNHVSVPKVTKKLHHKPAVHISAASKVHHHHHHKQTTKTAKKVVHDKKPAVKKVQTAKKVHDKIAKKGKNPVKALVMKHKETTKKVVHDKKVTTKKVYKGKVKKVADKPLKKQKN